MFESVRENLALSSNRSAHYVKLPSQIINLGLVLSEANGERIHLAHEQQGACLLNPSGRDSQSFTKLLLFPIVAPEALVVLWFS